MRRAILLLLAFAAAARLAAQPAPVVSTTLRAVVGYPSFFHERQVTIRGRVEPRGPGFVVSSDESPKVIYLLARDVRLSEGLAQVRGQVLDVGRLQADDPRVVRLDLQGLVGEAAGGRWPGPGELIALAVTEAVDAAPLSAPTVRTIALDPGRYDGERVSVTGQFGGRNLYGDLPQAPGLARWDFVLRSAGGAVWVTGKRPKGRGFDLDPGRRVDTGTWLTVTGHVRRRDALVWIEAAAIEVSKPEAPADAARPATDPGPPPEVRFSVPIEGETDVAATTIVRVQFTGDLDPDSLAGHTRVSYTGGEQATAAVAHTASWDPANRVLTIRFTSPLERFRTVKVELGDGISGTDGQRLKPWTLTFTTG